MYTEEPPPPGVHGLAVLTVCSALFLVFAGGMVTSTGSGLAVPDWPLAFGRLVPPSLGGGVFFEYGHRVAAGAVMLLTFLVVLRIHRAGERPWVRRLALAALLAVLLQALLGGATVLLELPLPVSVSHALLAELFVTALAVLAWATSPAFRRPGPPVRFRGAPPLPHLAILAAGCLFFQAALGAVMRHLGAGLAIPDFPTSFGRWIPDRWDAGIAFHFAHRLFALPAAGVALWACWRTFHEAGDEEIVARPAAFLGAGVLLQILLGILVVLSGRNAVVASLHVALGASLVAASAVLAVSTARLAARRSTSGGAV